MKTTSLLFLLAIGAPAFAQEQAPPDRAAVEAARQECATKYGITLPSRGTRPASPPSEAERAKFKKLGECMSAKGFATPPRGHHSPPLPLEESDDSGAQAAQ